MRTKLIVALVPALLAACSQTPAEIVFENAPATIDTMDAVPVPTAIVKDEEGKPLEKQPELVYEAKPESILQLTGSTMTPIKSGEAKLTARLREGELSKDIKITVQLVDRIVLECEPDDCKFAPGVTFRVRATPRSGDAKVEGATIEWTSDNEKVVRVKGNGEFEALDPGTAKIQAMTRGITAGQNITVVSPVEQLVVVCPDPPFAVFAPSSDTNDRRCVVGVGESIMLTAEVRGGGEVMDRRVAWKSTDSRYVLVSGGTAQGAQEGAAIVEASIENLRLQLPVEVRRSAKAQCPTGLSERYDVPGRDAPTTLMCGGPEAVRCVEKATAKKKLDDAGLAAAARKCCCTEIPPIPHAKDPSGKVKKPEEAPDDGAKPDDDAAPEGDKPDGDETKEG